MSSATDSRRRRTDRCGPRPATSGDRVADTAAQLEAVFLRLWEELWPAERARFSFCTGALMPRANAGALLDLQAVPRAIPPSQFRKSAERGTRPRPRDAGQAGGVGGRGARMARRKAMRPSARGLRRLLGADAGRGVVPSLVPIFGEWHAPARQHDPLSASVVEREGAGGGSAIADLSAWCSTARNGVGRQQSARAASRPLRMHRDDRPRPADVAARGPDAAAVRRVARRGCRAGSLSSRQ